MTWHQYKRAWHDAAREDSCAAAGWVCWHIIAAGLLLAVVLRAVQ